MTFKKPDEPADPGIATWDSSDGVHIGNPPSNMVVTGLDIGALSGLADDDNTQYIPSGKLDFNIPSESQMDISVDSDGLTLCRPESHNITITWETVEVFFKWLYSEQITKEKLSKIKTVDIMQRFTKMIRADLQENKNDGS